jgi:hypothetical protein
MSSSGFTVRSKMSRSSAAKSAESPRLSRRGERPLRSGRRLSRTRQGGRRPRCGGRIPPARARILRRTNGPGRRRRRSRGSPRGDVRPGRHRGDVQRRGGGGTANAVPYGLSASVWTENARRSHDVASQLDAGTVWVNSHLILATEAPWGGFKGSGYGRDLSIYALDDYSRTKHVMHNHGR